MNDPGAPTRLDLPPREVAASQTGATLIRELDEDLVARLGLSHEARQLYEASDVLDLHIDSYIPTRLFGYDLRKRHGRGLFGARLYSHADFPRVRDAGLTGGIWAITTNPFRTGAGRERAFFRNLEALLELLRNTEGVALARNAADYRAARARGEHAVFVGIQGGNALSHDLDAFDRIPDRALLQVTLMHMTPSELGSTSTPLPGFPDRGLGRLGDAYVRALAANRILIDLAHASEQTFYDVVAIADRSVPLIVTHAGVRAVYPHWRNLSDRQLRCIADTDGTVGVIFHSHYLGAGARGRRAETIVDHLEHIVQSVGEDHASLGSDWDGMILTPRDMPTCLELPILVEKMLSRGFSPDCVQKILGGNALRVIERARG